MNSVFKSGPLALRLRAMHGRYLETKKYVKSAFTNMFKGNIRIYATTTAIPTTMPINNVLPGHVCPGDYPGDPAASGLWAPDCLLQRTLVTKLSHKIFIDNFGLITHQQLSTSFSCQLLAL